MQLRVKNNICSAILLFLCVFLCACDAPVTYSLQGGQPNEPVISDGGIAIAQGEHVYYLNGDNYVRNSNQRLHGYRGAICRMNADGNRQILCDDDVSIFNLKGDTVWYVAYKSGVSTVYKINIDGSGKTKLTDMDDVHNGGCYAFTGQTIYFTVNGCLYAMDASGKGRRQITKSRICSLIAGDDGVYYTDYANQSYGAIYYVGNGDDEPKQISSESGYALDFTGSVLYYQLYSNGFCYAFDKNTGKTVSVAHLGYEDYCFSSQTEYIFASFLSEDKDAGIFRIDPSTGTRKLICSDRAERMLYHDGYVYYINDSALYSPYRVSADGQDRQCLTDTMTSSAALLDIVGDWLYYFNDDDESRIYRINLKTLKHHCIELESNDKA